MPVIANCIIFAAQACQLVVGQVDWEKAYTPVTLSFKPATVINELQNDSVTLLGFEEPVYQSPEWYTAKKKLKAMIGNKTVACVGYIYGHAGNFGANCFVPTKHGMINVGEELNKLGRTTDIR